MRNSSLPLYTHMLMNWAEYKPVPNGQEDALTIINRQLDAFALMVAGGFGEVHERIDELHVEMNTKFDAMRQEMNSKFDSINRRIDDLAMNRVKYEHHQALESRVEKIERAVSSGVKNTKSAKK